MVLDYYKILGIDKNSSSKEIRQAYLRLAKIFHPDVNYASDAEERFKEINEAYSILIDQSKKQEYDTSFEDLQEFEKEFKEKIKDLDIFTKYVKLMQEYRSPKKANFDATISDYFGHVVEVTLNYDDIYSYKFKTGMLVSLRVKGVIEEGVLLSELSAQGTIWKIRQNRISIEILEKRKANLTRNAPAKLKIEEDTRFLFNNISRHFDKIFNNLTKYRNFRRLVTDVFIGDYLGLTDIGIFEPQGKTALKFNVPLNKEQSEFVVKGYEVFKEQNGYVLGVTGPGGTGKTRCIVELIRQILSDTPKAKILVTSFTNVAVDNVFLKLIEEDENLKDKIIRVAQDERIKLREVRNVAVEAKRKSGKVMKDLIQEHNVIGATLDKLGTPLFDEYDFDIAIVDESSMIEFSKLVLAIAKSSKLILVGDEKQLNPFLGDEVVRYLKKNEFTDEQVDHVQQSFFSRLIKYLKETNSTGLVQLREQFRSYEEIMAFPNKEFYGGILKSNVSKQLREKYDFLYDINYENIFFEHLISPDKTMVWLDTSTLNPEKLRYSSDRNWSSEHKGGRRYFHLAQAALTCIVLGKYLDELYIKYKGDLTYRKKIGIIAPFNDQVELIRNFLFENPTLDPYLRDHVIGKTGNVDKALEKIERYLFLCSLEVGTVHKFQGREKDIILYNITSFTGMGDPKILKDPKLLNVAVTRARCKFVILGSVRPTLPYYNDLYSPRYLHIMGVKHEETPEKLDKQNFFKRMNLVDTTSFHGSYLGIDINDYFRQDTNLRDAFANAVNKLEEIQDLLISRDLKEEFLTEHEEYESMLRKLESYINLKDAKEALIRKVKDAKEREITLLLLHNLDFYVKNIFSNNDFDDVLILSLKRDLNKLLDTELLENLPEIASLEGKSRSDRISGYEKMLKKSHTQAFQEIILSRISKIKYEMERLQYKTGLEKEVGFNLDSYEDVILLNITDEYKDKIVNKIENMDKKLFIAYSRDLCKTIINDGNLKKSHYPEPFNWLKDLVSKKPDAFDLEVWLVLRVLYDKRFT